jgi:hypothetical protein
MLLDVLQIPSLRSSNPPLGVEYGIRQKTATSPFGKRVVWEFQNRPFFAAQKSPKNAKNLFDATPYPTTTSDPIRAIFKNITGFEPRDLIT